MSKSLGNIVLVRELLKTAPGEAIRLALLNAHYRQPLDWSDEVLVEATKKLDRLYGSLRDVNGWQEQWKSVDPDAAFAEALEDDLNTPRALAALFEIARQINRSDAEPERIGLAATLRASADMLGLLGAEPEQWFTVDDTAALSAEEIDTRLTKRNNARAAGDYAAADRIRDELAELGISIEDGTEGTRWRRG